ncbi:MAG: adenosylmethionine--8-amino-7-oxononanoate transaminase [Steroidobacteraceae bacterium]
MATPPVPDLVARDLAHVWHPCTQMKDHEGPLPLIPLRSGSGVWLEAHDGRRYLDAVSSWWVNLFGQTNPVIGGAVREQLDRLEHVIFAGFTHEPAIGVAEELVRIAPPGLTRVFFADNGSAAIEVAVKMSYHYWRNRGRPDKRRFVTLANSYHGETLGALAVGNVELYKEIYRPLLMDVLVAPSPDDYEREPGVTREDHARQRFAPMRALLERHAHEVSAVILEPLVQCAGSMRMYHPLYLQLLRETCDELDVHLIADEIAVGFGRTGTLFACEQAEITPDFLCLSKGLTGGFLPLSVVLTRDGVYDAFYADYAEQRAFLHSHSYTGNPLACAAARATLGIFAREPVIERNRETARLMAEAARPLASHPRIADVRQTGMILAVEMVRDARTRQTFAAGDRRGLRAYRHALSRGVLLRPIGDVLYAMPPYVITPDEVKLVFDVMAESVEVATCD